MITINNLTVRLGGRAILDGAAAAIPLNGRIGLIGRNGAGKSTLMKVLIGEPDPDQGSVEMPRRARVGYIAQEAPSDSITPFDAVLAGDVERTRLLEQADMTCLATFTSAFGQSMGELTRTRAAVSAQLEDVESEWLANESLERTGV